MKNKYSRPYCKNCKLIYGNSSIGRILYCTKCNRSLTLKTFNPWINVVGGLVILCLGGLTLFVKEIPIIWIGGFLFGGSLFFNGFNQWAKIKKLDGNRDEIIKETMKDDHTHTIITCGKCAQKIRILKGRGIVNIKCPGCAIEHRIMT